MKYQDRINERSRSEWETLIGEWVHNKLDRQLLKWRMLDGLSFRSICDELDEMGEYLSLDQVKKRLYKAQNQLFKHT